MTLIRKAEAGPLIEVGGSVAPLTHGYYVDSSFLGESNGSIAAPYRTIDEAMAAAVLAAVDSLTLIVCPGSYGASSINMAAIPKVTIFGMGAQRQIQIDSLAVTFGPSFASLNLFNVQMFGTIVIDDAVSAGGLLYLYECFAQDITSTQTQILAYNSGLSGIVNGTVVRGFGCDFNGDITSDTAAFYDCRVFANVACTSGLEAYSTYIQHISAAAQLLLEGCQANLDGLALSSGSGHSIRSTVNLSGASPSTINFAAPGGVIFFDSVSWNSFNRGTHRDLTITNGRADFGSCPNAIITVALPVVAAGQLMYLDVSLVGTALEGTLAGSPIGFNPTTDIKPVGALGGPVSARVSADNTVRLTLFGTLAAGNTNILFWRP